MPFDWLAGFLRITFRPSLALRSELAMAVPGETENQRRVWTMFVICCCCSSLLLLSICWGGIWSSLGLTYSRTHAQDVAAAEPSLFNPGAKSVLSTSVWKYSSKPVDAQIAEVTTETWRLPEGEKYMWYSPHGGFSNQARELMNALKIAFLLNRTLVLPPVFDHFEVELGTCFAPLRDQRGVRKLAWSAIIERFDPSTTRAYVSIADIIDLSSIKSTVKTIDLRVFLALWCGIDISRTCSGPVCHTLARELQLGHPAGPPGTISSCAAQFFSTSEGHHGPNLIHEVQDDCRTTLWTNGESLSEKLYLEERLRHQLHSDTSLPSDTNASSISIERKDVIKTLGPASTAGSSFLLAFGTLFSRHYEDRTLLVDITAPRRGKRMSPILTAIERQRFSVEILDVGRYFVQEKIVGPFFCAHVRLGDGAFQFNQERNIFRPLRQRLQQLEMMSNRTTSGPLNLFLMTDLPREKWQGTYLNDLHVNHNYKIHTMDRAEDLFNDVIQNIYSHEYGLLQGFLPQLKFLRKIGSNLAEEEIMRQAYFDEEKSNTHAFSLRLFVEEVICSCATLGFQGTVSSTISRNIANIRKAQSCPI